MSQKEDLKRLRACWDEACVQQFADLQNQGFKRKGWNWIKNSDGMQLSITMSRKLYHDHLHVEIMIFGEKKEEDPSMAGGSYTRNFTFGDHWVEEIRVSSKIPKLA